MIEKIGFTIFTALIVAFFAMEGMRLELKDVKNFVTNLHKFIQNA